MLPTSAGVEPAISWSPVGQHIQLSHRGRLMYQYKFGQNPSIHSRDRVQTRCYANANTDAKGICTESNMSPCPQWWGSGGGGGHNIQQPLHKTIHYCTVLDTRWFIDEPLKCCVLTTRILRIWCVACLKRQPFDMKKEKNTAPIPKGNLSLQTSNDPFKSYIHKSYWGETISLSCILRLEQKLS